MGPVTAQLLDELGYDPDVEADPELADVMVGRVPLAPEHIVRAREPGGWPVAVARLASGRLVVVADRCPHDGGRISDGFVEGEHIVCARHQWELEVVGGQCRRRVFCKLRE
jgi:nitrite reductase (NADH) small subunit